MMEEKQNKNNKLNFFIIIIIIGIILLFSKKENQEKFIGFLKSSKTINKRLKTVESIPINKDIDNIGFYEKGIMIWTDKKLIRLKSDGSKEWEKEFNLDDPMVTFGQKNIYVYERSTGDIYFLNGAGETINRVQLNAQINNLIERFENVLVHIKNPDIESLTILNRDGEIIENTLAKDRNILTYSMNRDNTTYVLSTLNLKWENLKSEIQAFQLGEKLLFTTEFNNEIIMYTNFIEKNKLIVMSDKGLYCFDQENILWKKQFQLVKDIYIDKEKVNVLYGNTLETISPDGKIEYKYLFTEEYNKIIPYDKYLVLYGDGYIIGLRNGEEVFKYKSEETILKVVQGKENLIIIYDNKIDFMSL